jgi:hypothetical protein
VVAPSLAQTSIKLTNNELSRFTTFRDGTQVIHLPGGNYRVTETIRLPSNTILEGEGPETILIGDAFFVGSRFITNQDFLLGNTNITIRSLKVELDVSSLKGNLPGIIRIENVNNLLVENVTMEINSALYGVDLSAHMSNSVVKECNIVNTGKGGGIMVRNREKKPVFASNNITLSNNRIMSVNDEPIAVFGWLGVVQDVIIERNNIEAIGASFGISVFGIDQTGHTGKIDSVKVSENTIKGGRIGGITVKGGAENVEVSDNTIKGQNGDGVFLHTGGQHLPVVQDIKVHHNVITDSGRHGIFATGKNILVDGNKISNSKGGGIYVGSDVAVLNNTITNARPGIIVDGRSPRAVRMNTLRNSGKILIMNKDKTGIENNITE